jgi:hypothetical protein
MRHHQIEMKKNKMASRKWRRLKENHQSESTSRTGTLFHIDIKSKAKKINEMKLRCTYLYIHAAVLFVSFQKENLYYWWVFPGKSQSINCRVISTFVFSLVFCSIWTLLYVHGCAAEPLKQERGREIIFQNGKSTWHYLRWIYYIEMTSLQSLYISFQVKFT